MSRWRLLRRSPVAGVAVALACAISTAFFFASLPAPVEANGAAVAWGCLSASFIAAGLMVDRWVWPAAALVVPPVAGIVSGAAMGGGFGASVGAVFGGVSGLWMCGCVLLGMGVSRSVRRRDAGDR